MAVALPIDLPGRNTYVSFNMEANYVLPSSSTDYTQGFSDKIIFADGVEPDETANEARKTESFHFISRRNLYSLIEQKMDVYGLDGRACLLRLICDVSNNNFYESNGVLGNLFHILFT